MRMISKIKKELTQKKVKFNFWTTGSGLTRFYFDKDFLQFSEGRLVNQYTIKVSDKKVFELLKENNIKFTAKKSIVTINDRLEIKLIFSDVDKHKYLEIKPKQD